VLFDAAHGSGKGKNVGPDSDSETYLTANVFEKCVKLPTDFWIIFIGLKVLGSVHLE
jgi:hypothetical protein